MIFYNDQMPNGRTRILTMYKQTKKVIHIETIKINRVLNCFCKCIYIS